MRWIGYTHFMISPQKQTKIICTIGPASDSEEMLIELIKAGMNVCRLNFSHNTHEYHRAVIERTRRAAQTLGVCVTILQDLQGPKIRVGDLPEAGVIWRKGQEVVLTGVESGPREAVLVSYPLLHQDVKPKQKLLFDDGLLSVEVIRIDGTLVICRVVDGGTLLSHKGLSLPETQLSISAVSEKDHEDLVFGVEQGVDWIALSFVRSADDVRRARALIREAQSFISDEQRQAPRVMVKIEKQEALESFDDLLHEADGIMVARGDLGIEIPFEQVPIWQKRLIERCRAVGKPVVVATQMLDSMIRHPRATRAEVSDIANAVEDGADATMLSGETASGEYPLEALQAMTRTILEAELHLRTDAVIDSHPSKEAMRTNIAHALMDLRGLDAILIVSPSLDLVGYVSRFRPRLPILVAVPSEAAGRVVNIQYGVIPCLIEPADTMPDLVRGALDAAVRSGRVMAGQTILLVAGDAMSDAGHATLVETIQV